MPASSWYNRTRSKLHHKKPIWNTQLRCFTLGAWILFSGFLYWLLQCWGFEFLVYITFISSSFPHAYTSCLCSFPSTVIVSPALISLTWSVCVFPCLCRFIACYHVFPVSWTLYFASSLLDGFASFEPNPWFSALLALVTFSLINYCTGPAPPAASTFGSQTFPSISDTFFRNHALVWR